MFKSYLLFKYLLLFIRQYDHLENYVAKELIRDVRAKYQAKKLKMDKAKEDEV